MPVFDLICVEIAEKISVQGNGSKGIFTALAMFAAYMM